MKSLRTFQVWEYRVSLGQLLIRSPINASYDYNQDLIFMGVQYMSLPNRFEGIELVEPTDEEIQHIKKYVKNGHEMNKLYILESKEIRFSVFAVSMKISENKMDLFESHFDI